VPPEEGPKEGLIDEAEGGGLYKNVELLDVKSIPFIDTSTFTAPAIDEGDSHSTCVGEIYLPETEVEPKLHFS
jgi:hypothetical protein